MHAGQYSLVTLVKILLAKGFWPCLGGRYFHSGNPITSGLSIRYYEIFRLANAELDGRYLNIQVVLNV
jgi:hypothetical protein